MIAVICGGVGAARLLRGLTAVHDPADVVAIVNTGDDLEWHGLHVSPDIDTIIYTLAGHEGDTGWGLAGETFAALDALRRFGGSEWFSIGDRDLATHLVRSDLLRGGATLAEATGKIAAAFGLRLRIVPATNDRLRTMLTTASGEEIDFQEYFVHRRHGVAIASVRFVGAGVPAAPGVLEALEDAETIVVAPSNPVLSVAPVLAVRGVEEVLRRRRDVVVAISPIVAGHALKGPADRLLADLGHEPTALGVARLCAAFTGTFVLDDDDAAYGTDIEALGMSCVATDTIMRDAAASRALAERAIRASTERAR